MFSAGRSLHTMPGRVRPGATLSALLLSLLPGAMPAPAAEAPPSPPSVEAWTGAEIADDVWMLYGGATIAPSGGLATSGFRLRAAGGYGQYRYDGWSPALPGRITRHVAQVTFAEAMLGWQVRFGALTAKAFAGLAMLEHAVDPGITSALLTKGEDYGPKGALELWLDIGRSAFASFDANWTGAHDTYAGRLRVGYRLSGPLSVGLEAGVSGHASATNAIRLLADERPRPAARVGAFARYELSSGEISLSAGLAARRWEAAENPDVEDVYATVNWLSKY